MHLPPIHASLPGAFVAMALAVGPAMAQSPTVDVGGGYAFTLVADEMFPLGWRADIGLNLRRSPLWLVGEASGAYDSRSRTSGNIRVRTATRFHNFFFGLRLKRLGDAGAQPYLEALVGALHATATDSFEALAPGGPPVPSGSFPHSDDGLARRIGAGVMVPLTARVAASAGFDYCGTLFEAHEFDARIVRLTAGMTWAFGPR